MPTLKERREHGISHIRAWQSSNQSIDQYCETHGLKPSTFKYWKQRYDATASKAEQRFLPMQVEPMPTLPLERLELHLSHPLRLTLANGVDPAWLAKLLRELHP
jgi:hypothetical protein